MSEMRSFILRWDTFFDRLRMSGGSIEIATSRLHRDSQ